MSDTPSRLTPALLGHKTRSFLKFLRRDPGGALRRLRGYSQAPLFLFQMGKVGSSTHRNTLQTLYHVYHLHTLAEFREKYQSAGAVEATDLDLITIVREPLGRKISTFFQNLVDSPYAFRFENREAALSAGVDELLKRFREWEDGIPEATEWYGRHFEPGTGIRIYDHGFDPSQGWQIFRSGQWRVLVLRFEDIAVNHLEALNEFVVGRCGEKAKLEGLRNSNVSSVKWYSELMKEFRQQLRFTEEEITAAYDSDYCRYFYTGGEIDKMREKWSFSG